MDYYTQKYINITIKSLVLIMKDKILFEDNHLIVVNKLAGQLVQKDKTGDRCLIDDLKFYLKNTYNKPGEVFLGVPHRLDRPTSGIVLFTKTSKALTRMAEIFKKREIKKKYWALVSGKMDANEGVLTCYLAKNEKRNKSFVHGQNFPGAKLAELSYKLIQTFDKYNLLEVELKTGRHHQIRVQLSDLGLIIKGDLKYGAKRPNDDKSISLHARTLEFIHPVKKTIVKILASLPDSAGWHPFKKIIENQKRPHI